MKKQKDGRYHTSVRVGRDADNKPVDIPIAAHTKKELEDKRDEVKRAYITPAVKLDRDVLASVYINDWYNRYKRSQLKAGPQNSLSSVINKHILPEVGNKRLAAVTARDLQDLLNKMEGKSKTLVCDARDSLKSVFSLAAAEGVIDRDPSTRLALPRLKKRDSRRALTEEEEAAALRVGWEHEDGLLLLILYYTGARLGEALGLQWQDIDFKNNMIHIQRDVDHASNSIDTLKTQGSDRYIPLTTALRRALWPRRGIGETHVLRAPRSNFIPKSTYIRLWIRLREAMYQADPTIEAQPVREKKEWQLSEDGERKRVAVPVMGSILTAHYFRHNYATILYYAGVDLLMAQNYLGHEDAVTTLRIYTHLRKQSREMDKDTVYAKFFTA